MAKSTILLLIFLYLTSTSYAQDYYKMKGVKRVIELLDKDVSEGKQEFPRCFEYIKKNSTSIKAEAIQIIIDNDSISCFLANVYEGDKSKPIVALLETINEIIYEGKVLNNQVCFLAGTFTYTNKLDEEKTVPVYYTLDRLNSIILEIFQLSQKQK